ncbi:MAG: hypothetical protein SF069_06415 [Phycisphaerae bacterium]|nr:hypothetical protein [Phycisphaerae bacterium]
MSSARLVVTTSNTSAAISGINSRNGGAYVGVEGSASATDGYGGHFTALGDSGTGVYGTANTGSAPWGVYGRTSSGNSNAHAIHGTATSGSAYAGYFNGRVNVTGTLSKGGGSFKIDHPLDPENKYLLHSFVESPDMMNIYNGNIVTDSNGSATVTLPDWFGALNRDFRYQLTPIGSFSRAMVSQEVNGNRFVIRTEQPNVKVSWQVTGIRRDAFANANRIPVEEEKPIELRGTYLHPQAFGKPGELMESFLEEEIREAAIE